MAANVESGSLELLFPVFLFDLDSPFEVFFLVCFPLVATGRRSCVSTSKNKYKIPKRQFDLSKNFFVLSFDVT